MGRVKFDDIEHYGGSGGAGFFKLTNDKDVARVRILYNSIDDVEAFAVHKVDTPDSQYGRYVSCLRSYNESKDKCPLCKAGYHQNVRLFIPIYNIDEDKVQIWDRGKKFAQKITSLCSRYPNLVSHVFEIERNGAKGEKTTTYEIYEVDQDDTTLEDLDVQMQDILGGAVLDKSKDDMEYYIESGEFPPEEDEEPVRRRSSSRRDEDEEDRPRRSTRRTPASRRNSEDDF